MKLKKILAYTTALLICSNVMVAPQAQAKDVLTSIVASAEDENLYSGSCGENATWSFDEDTGTLTISGTGEMENYNYYSDCSWDNYRNSIKSIIIEDGITSIGSYAFDGYQQLTKVIIPNSVISIGNSAFYSCSSLESIIIPNSVTSIDSSAFRNCISLTEITIPSSVTSIDGKAFDNTPFIENITDDFIIFNNILYKYQGDSTNITIPNSVTSVGSWAFYECTSLESIVIPNSVTSIDYCAFCQCTALKEINIPDSVTSIGMEAFSDCTSLTEITIPDSVTSIDYYVFNGCTSLESIIIPNSVTSIGSCAFSNCTSLTEITIPDSVTSIGSSAFSNCTSLKSITIPNSITSIEGGEFEGCTSLESIIIPNSVTSIGNVVFKGCTSLESIIIPNSVTSIGIEAFKDCISLKEINIPNSVTSIDRWAFSGCTSLENITILSNAKYLDDLNSDVIANLKSISSYVGKYSETFANENNITFIPIYEGTLGDNINWKISEDGTTLTISGTGDMPTNDCFFNNTKLKNIIIEDGVTSISRNAFKGCTSLTSITIPDSVTSIDVNALRGCTSLTSIDIPNSVTFIGSSAIRECTALESITIPNSVTSISTNLFMDCTSLESVTIPNSVTSIDVNAFRGCTSLIDINIPDSVNFIGGSAFMDCTSLESITIPDGVEFGQVDNKVATADDDKTSSSVVAGFGGYSYYSSSDTFKGCTSLKNVNIPNGTTCIDGGTFDGCTSLTSITIPDSVTQLGYDAFNGCTSLTDVIIENKELLYNNYARLDEVFVDTPYLSYDNNGFLIKDDLLITYSAYYDENYQKFVEENPNYYEDGIEYTINVPDGIAVIGREAFYPGMSYYSGIIVLPESVTRIESAAFRLSYEHLQNLPSNLEYIGAFAFEGCLGLKDIDLSSVKYIGNGAFEGCEELENVILSDNLTQIGCEAFAFTPYLEKLRDENGFYIDNNILLCYDYYYETDTYIENDEIVIPDGVVTVADGICAWDTILTIPKSVINLNNLIYDEELNCYLTIKGYTGSTAETWANEKGATFIPLDDTNKANLMDILRIKKYLFGLSYASAGLDTNEDGNIDILDMISLKSKILNE